MFETRNVWKCLIVYFVKLGWDEFGYNKYEGYYKVCKVFLISSEYHLHTITIPSKATIAKTRYVTITDPNITPIPSKTTTTRTTPTPNNSSNNNDRTNTNIETNTISVIKTEKYIEWKYYDTCPSSLIPLICISGTTDRQQYVHYQILLYHLMNF